MPKLVFSNGRILENIDLIIFDKDGTIFDIHYYWCSMIRLRSKALVEAYFKKESSILKDKIRRSLESKMGFDHSLNKLKPEGPIGAKPRSFIVKVATDYLLGNNLKVDCTMIESIFCEVDKSSTENLSSLLELLPGVVDLIKDSYNSGIKLAVATMDLSTRAELAMSETNIKSYFDLILGSDSVERSKPDPHIILKTLEELNISPERSIMIGDHSVDLKMAKAANLQAGIGVATGLSSKENLKNYSEHIVDNLREVKVVNDR